MKNMTWKQLLACTLAALFVMATHTAAFAQRPSGTGRPSGGQRPPNAGRENSPYKDKHQNGQVRPPESRGKQGGRPQGAFPRN